MAPTPFPLKDKLSSQSLSLGGEPASRPMNARAASNRDARYDAGALRDLYPRWVNTSGNEPGVELAPAAVSAARVPERMATNSSIVVLCGRTFAERESSAESQAAPDRERMSARNRSRCSVISRIVAGGAAVW